VYFALALQNGPETCVTGKGNPYDSSALVLRTMMRYAWKESRIVDQRLQFLSSYQKEEMSVSELCSEFGVSRRTGYRWINRYKESGPEGLLNLSSKPHSCSHATPEAIENAILALRGNILPGEQGSSRRG
jgi:transposase-like protein